MRVRNPPPTPISLMWAVVQGGVLSVNLTIGDMQKRSAPKATDMSSDTGSEVLTVTVPQASGKGHVDRKGHECSRNSGVPSCPHHKYCQSMGD